MKQKLGGCSNLLKQLLGTSLVADSPAPYVWPESPSSTQLEEVARCEETCLPRPDRHASCLPNTLNEYQATK